jgi:SNF2 family DNA or RNA helicase
VAVAQCSALIRLAPDGTALLRCPFEDRHRAKSVAGWRWHRASKTWRYPASAEVLAELRAAFPDAAVDPALLAFVRDGEARRSHAGQAPQDDLPVRAALYEHQRRAAGLALRAPAYGFWMEMGTGKTLTAIAVAGRRYLDGDILRCLVVCPRSVMPVWAAEFVRFASFPHTLATLDGSTEQRSADLRRLTEHGRGLQVAVLNYEATWRMEDALKPFCRGQMVVADESHRIKTPSARQSRAMHGLGRAAAYRLALTGTPITQSPLDLYSQYRFLDPSIFGPSYYAFRNRYAVMGGFQEHQVVSYQRLDELTRRANAIAYRVTRAECLDLPPEVSQTVSVGLGAAARRLYDTLKRDAIAELESRDTVTAVNVLTEILRLQQITGGFVGTDQGGVSAVGTEKLDACCDLLTDLVADERRKVVVFCRFLPEIAALSARIEASGIPCGTLSGETKERGELVRRFQEEDSPRVLVIQIQTGGLGITLHRADTAIFYSAGWSLADYEQAKARIQRAGQAAERVQYIHLAAEKTVDETIYRALAEKRDVAEAIASGWRPILEG